MIGIRGRARLTGGKANFQALAEYILREGKHEDKHEPILGTWSQGLSASDAIAAGREMSAVAGKSRVKDDPIYHLILSWAPGEQPSADQAKEAVKMPKIGQHALPRLAPRCRDLEFGDRLPVRVSISQYCSFSRSRERSTSPHL